MIEKRVSDSSVLRLIRKWIQIGVIDQGQFLVSGKGTGQGQTISPLLANIYLHYVLDEWFEDVVKLLRSVLPMMPYSASTTWKTQRR